jgi:hypothetical protein
MIQQFIQALLRITQLKTTDKEEALLVIDQTSRNLFGFDLTLINSLSSDDLLSFLNTGDSYTNEKSLILSRILMEEGEILNSLNREKESFNCYLKSLRILLKIYPNEVDSALEPDLITIEEITDKLEYYELPPDVRKNLFDYFESKGDHDKALEFCE